MTLTAPVQPAPENRPVQKAARVRRDEEPRGRWQDRCDFIGRIGLVVRLICDRPDAHMGMHSGRLLDDEHVIGYGRLR